MWGAKSVGHDGGLAEAIQYAERAPGGHCCLPRVCSAGLWVADEASSRYAVQATYATTNLAALKSYRKEISAHAARDHFARPGGEPTGE